MNQLHAPVTALYFQLIWNQNLLPQKSGMKVQVSLETMIAPHNPVYFNSDRDPEISSESLTIVTVI